jgi:hypothetical protein
MTISEKTGPSSAMAPLLAAACGFVVANIYYLQPLIDMIGPSVGLGPRDANAHTHHGHDGTAAALVSRPPRRIRFSLVPA